jgi:hypothetical protein
MIARDVYTDHSSRYRAMLTLRAGGFFLRAFPSLDHAKALCNRVAMADALSTDLSSDGHSRFVTFAIVDMHNAAVYSVADYDDYFGIEWHETACPSRSTETA